MPDIPITIGYEVDKAIELLKGYKVIVEETSTVFADKIEERKGSIPVVVRQNYRNNSIILTAARFK